MKAEQSPEFPAPTVIVLGSGSVDIWGMSSGERLRRSFARVGMRDVRFGAGDLPPAGIPAILIRADHVFDQRLIEALVKSPGTALVPDGGQPVLAVHTLDAAASLEADEQGLSPAGLETRTPAGLAGSYNNKLRKREEPFLLPLTRQNLPAIRDRTFQASYKGVTDFITKHVWPPPAKVVTGWCASAGITPNQVTLASLGFVLLAFWLFWHGHFGWGLVCAWIMTFLDTVDGKLARVTMTYSKGGDVLDHGIDLVHPPFWWWAWMVGCGAAGFALPYYGLVLFVIVGGYIAQRIEEGVFIKLFRIEMHIWRPFDSWFRGITARRNPNLLILTVLTLFGRPDLGILLVAVWTGLCFLVHLWQIVAAGLASRQGPIRSWLAG
ncbi:CDP-alcohol phosphatidyltransferase family protein [Aureimonas psammosilenae]|uniref:CDP-alcohol phosphatidyltransferase family protein n=1 Tax=Aureimonas psammosilenae TaxID=2495496 RepID=UPI001F1B76D1|nr:CDP-alcohol phosphatidyltransferase family protein [Aureimonas psammosilenae]